MLVEDKGEDIIPLPGTLIVEPYTWKRIVAPAPLLRISTTSTKSAALSIKPG